MKKLVLALGLSAFSGSVLAIPNVWDAGEGEIGWVDNYITNNQGDLFKVSCNWAYDGKTDHKILLMTRSGKQFDRSTVEILIDGKNVTPKFHSMTKKGSLQWHRFTNALEKGKMLDIYVANKKVATFKPTKNSHFDGGKPCLPIGEDWGGNS